MGRRVAYRDVLARSGFTGRFAADQYRELYADIWAEFAHEAQLQVAPSRDSDGAMLYDLAAVPPRSMPRPALIHSPSPTDTRPVATQYSATRLTFKASVIEALSEEQVFEVATPVGTFRLSKHEFYDAFPNVVRSNSYRTAGLYHYPTVPKMAEPFRVRAGD